MIIITPRKAFLLPTQSDHPDNHALAAYRGCCTKISRCRVNTTIWWEIKQLGISFGSIYPSIFLWKLLGEIPSPCLWWQPCHLSLSKFGHWDPSVVQGYQCLFLHTTFFPFFTPCLLCCVVLFCLAGDAHIAALSQVFTHPSKTSGIKKMELRYVNVIVTIFI